MCPSVTEVSVSKCDRGIYVSKCEIGRCVSKGDRGRSPPWLHHPFVDPICSFVTSQLKVARKHIS